MTINTLTTSVQSDASQVKEIKTGDSVSFLIKKHNFGKEGWKIMPEDESFDIKLNAPILSQAVQTVRYNFELKILDIYRRFVNITFYSLRINIID